MTARNRSITAHVITFVLLGTLPALAQSQEDDPGIRPSRAYVSWQPWEQIDTRSGALILTFTDLVLPGNGGLDLRITRTYSTHGGGTRWRFGPGRILYTDVPPGSEWYPNPLIETGDAGRQDTFAVSYGSSTFRTLSYWEYNRNDPAGIVRLPDGSEITYGCHWTAESQRYPTEFRDRYGNTLTYTYVVGNNEPVDNAACDNLEEQPRIRDDQAGSRRAGADGDVRLRRRG